MNFKRSNWQSMWITKIVMEHSCAVHRFATIKKLYASYEYQTLSLKGHHIIVALTVWSNKTFVIHILNRLGLNFEW